MRRPWIPMPTSWAGSLEWHELTPRARVLLHCLWCRSLDGSVPTDPKRAQLMAGVTDKPARISKALLELERSGFLKRSDASFFLVQWRQILSKFSANSPQKMGRNLPRDRAIPSSSASTPRGRVLSLREREKEKGENKQEPLGCAPAVSSDEVEALRERLK